MSSVLPGPAVGVRGGKVGGRLGRAGGLLICACLFPAERIDQGCFANTAVFRTGELDDLVGVLCLPLVFTPLPVAFDSLRDGVQRNGTRYQGDTAVLLVGAPLHERPRVAFQAGAVAAVQGAVIGAVIVARVFGDERELRGRSDAELSGHRAYLG